MYYLSREFVFDAAHRITDYQGKCEKLHGHTYHLKVTIKGDIKTDGMVIDFAIMKKIVDETVVNKLDHSYLNDLFKNPTTENVAYWIYSKLLKEFKKYHCTLYAVSLTEGSNNTVTFVEERNERRTE